MGKPIIVLADRDEAYLIPLEVQFLEAFGDRIELELITDEAYFQQCFLSAKHIDVLVIGEHWYSDSLLRHNMNNLFILTEQAEPPEQSDSTMSYIFKYNAIRDIFHQILATSSDNLKGKLMEKQDTQIVLLYSPIGGSGKTSLALGLCSHLSKHFKRVAYLNAEGLNTFGHLFPTALPVPSDLYQSLRAGDSNLYESIKPVLNQGAFHCFPPFRMALSSLDLPLSIYPTILTALQQSGDYDTIIVDTDSVFDEDKAQLIRMANKVLLVATPTPTGVHKMNTLLQNMNCSDKEKYHFIYNFSRPSDASNLEVTQTQPQFVPTEHIPYNSELPAMAVDALAGCTGIARLAYLIE